MFGQNPIYGQIPQTPPLPGMTPDMTATAAAPTAPSGGMFGAGGVGRSIAGMIGDFLLQRAGMQPIYQPTMMEKWKHQQEFADYNRKRTDDSTDWRTQYDYEVAHPKPQQPGEFEQTLIQSGIQPGTPEWTQAMVTRRQNLLDPPVMTPQGMMLRSQVVGGGGGQPAPAGITFTPLNPPAAPGGPTPGGSGGFPY